ncbi:MAG: 2-oxoacid:acceptor oxidoreductase subunit alpha [Candidatus Omnitrophica bacterium]|nr:2-oxoacid:acceptor oxidoreductase subunit alpha [Candidatus Omnitrophota bacterium]
MAKVNEISIKIGGEAGQGVESSGAGFSRALARGGLYVFGMSDYMSRIRGGYNYFQIRVSPKPVYAQTDLVDFVMAFNAQSVMEHLNEIVPGGGVIYDEAIQVDPAPFQAKQIKLLPLPLVEIAKKHGGDEIMANTASIGAVCGMVGYPFQYISDIITQNFKRKGDVVVQSNIAIAKEAYDLAKEKYARDCNYRLEPIAGASKRMMPHGNQAIVFGAIAAGCKFISAYPMTPATSVFEFLNAVGNQFGVLTKQTEDEVAAILMALGAAHTGVRAMTATSGGGFSLMVEALGMAGITETPLVVVEAQRVGPSTGLPTRTEQGDLLFGLYASQGDFPRIILTPGTLEECFDCGARAFNLAEKYQLPVIIFTDLYQSSNIRTIDLNAFDVKGFRVDRGKFLTDADLDKLNGDEYKRHILTADGISPRAVPGHPKAVFMTTSDEHYENGHITEEASVRIQQMEKRMKKLEAAKKDLQPPKLFGPAKADITYFCWGSTYGSLREAVERINESKKMTANLYHIVDMWPFPSEKVAQIVDGAKTTIVLDGNYTGNLYQLIRGYAGRTPKHSIRRYDGRPFSPEYILAKTKKLIPGFPLSVETVACDAKAEVLTHV